MKDSYVYIMTTKGNSALYTGVTGDLVRRVSEHKNNLVDGFTKLYKVHKLVYYEVAGDITAAIGREKQIKSWKREKKLRLISEHNPDWHDLFPEILE